MKVGRRKVGLPVDKIASLYEDGMSETQLAEMFNVGRSTIHRRLLEAEVYVRNAVEATQLRCFKMFPYNRVVYEMFSGLLLGDAWIEKDSRSEGRLCIEQCLDHKEWIFEISNVLSHHDIDHVVYQRKNRSTYGLRTKKYKNFSKLRRKWYPYGKKVVPRDIVLTETVLSHWYYGDGALANGYKIELCTEGFKDDDVVLLSKRLSNDFGIYSRINKRQNIGLRIYVSKKVDRIKFVDIVSGLCPKCFKYKLEIRR